MKTREITTCRACGAGQLAEVLDLGNLAISDFPARPEEELDRAPLVLVRCRQCALVQLRHTVDRERLYHDYHYRSGTNESMVRALEDVVAEACSWVRLEPGDTVADLGCNDGTMLRMFPEHLHRVGWEPSQLYVSAVRAGLHVVHGFFPDYFPEHLKVLRPKIVTSIAMFYDLDDPTTFVRAVQEWLHPEGVWIIQMATLEDMLTHRAFDNICHEHLEYYDRAALTNLLEAHGLTIASLSHNQVNGGSVRYIVRHAKAATTYRYGPATPLADLRRFADEVDSLRDETLALLRAYRAAGASIWGYGASTKGNTLLQVYGIGPDLLTAIADRQPDKWGRYTVTGIPIVGEAVMRAARPSYLLLLPWHFLDGFRERERPLLEQGTRFIVPLPRLRVVGPAPVARGDSTQGKGIDHAELLAQDAAPPTRPGLVA